MNENQREAIIRQTEENKIIAIIRGVESSKMLDLAKALYAGGVRMMEITYDASGKVSAQTTAENIRMLKEYFGKKMAVGAGTVLNPAQVELTEKAGGEFIISPDTNCSVIQKTRELGLVSMPGAMTPTEIQTAYLAGADFVKIFPATNLGPEYIKAIKAPLSHIRMLAVGGINEKNIPEYLAAGISGFGIGSNLTNKKMIAENDWEGITELTRTFLAALQNER